MALDSPSKSYTFQITLRHTLTQGSIIRRQILPQSPILSLKRTNKRKKEQQTLIRQILPQSPILAVTVSSQI
jgi:hypothetical protein